MATVGAMALELTDRCVVVTGGAHGIGRALADAFAALGAKVVVADVQLDRAERVAARLGGLALHCDVGDPDQIGVLVETAELAFGPVEVFCSNAGIGDLGQGLASSVADIERVLAVHQSVRGVADDGVAYYANDPHLLEWVHCAEMSMFLAGYQRFGRYHLSAADADRYVAEMAVLNPFDFFLEPTAEHFPFDYAPDLAVELAPYLIKAPATPKFAAVALVVKV